MPLSQDLHKYAIFCDLFPNWHRCNIGFRVSGHCSTAEVSPPEKAALVCTYWTDVSVRQQINSSYRRADKSWARPTSWCILFDGENISFDASLVYTHTHTHTHTHICMCVCIYIYIYIYRCPRRNVPDFGRVFLMLKHTDITQNTYVQIWTVTEITAREVSNFDSCYTLIDYQIHIKTGRNMWFL